MKARDAVLGALRAQSLPKVELPALTGDWIHYPDLVGQFGAALGRAAGTLVELPGGADLASSVAELAVVRRAQRWCSFVEQVPGKSALPIEPHGFSDVDVVLVAAEFGVAENGAVWIDERQVPERAGLFLAQHLVVLLRRAELVAHLHHAYTRLGARLGQKGYGCFISGPSKTADIEQALVVGAHGPRSLTLVLHAD
jgi:L-lactate dehydrogenase complex protein LldG